jgi:hypothetical protein
MIMRHLCLLGILAVLPLSQADTPTTQGPHPALDVPEVDSFVVELADGTSAMGGLEVLGEKWSVQVVGASPRRIAGENVLGLRRAQRLRPALPTGAQIILANGDRLPGQVVKLEGETLTCRIHLGKEQDLLVPLSAVTVIWLSAPDSVNQPQLFLGQLASGQRRQDIVYLHNGDKVEGLLAGWDRGGLQISTGKTAVRVELGKVAVVALNTELTRKVRPKESYAQVVLANGCRLSLISARADKDTLGGKTLFAAAVSIRLNDLVALTIYQGRAIYLSDLKPRAYEFTPYLGSVRWSYVRDGSVVDGSGVGAEMRLAGNSYEKGLGMHSASRLTYDLGGGYRRFEALVGIDDRGERSTGARIQVLVDGKAQIPEVEEEITPRGGPRRVRVDVSRASELTLLVGFGGRADIQGVVDWAEARLIK